MASEWLHANWHPWKNYPLQMGSRIIVDLDGKRGSCLSTQREQRRTESSVMVSVCTCFFSGGFTDCSLPNIWDITHQKKITAVINDTFIDRERKEGGNLLNCCDFFESQRNEVLIFATATEHFVASEKAL